MVDSTEGERRLDRREENILGTEVGPGERQDQAALALTDHHGTERGVRHLEFGRANHGKGPTHLVESRIVFAERPVVHVPAASASRHLVGTGRRRRGDIYLQQEDRLLLAGDRRRTVLGDPAEKGLAGVSAALIDHGRDQFDEQRGSIAQILDLDLNGEVLPALRDRARRGSDRPDRDTGRGQDTEGSGSIGHLTADADVRVAVRACDLWGEEVGSRLGLSLQTQGTPELHAAPSYQTLGIGPRG